jgi:hypothetical protein
VLEKTSMRLKKVFSECTQALRGKEKKGREEALPLQ